MQKDLLDRKILKENHSGSPKGNKRKNLRKDKIKVLHLQEGKWKSSLPVTEGSPNQLPVAERGQDLGLN